MEVTPYGKKMRGTAPIVIIAPHAAGDDRKTGLIATKLARALGGFLLINSLYKKPTNSKAALFPEYIEDFNRLSWSYKKEKYLWSKKNPNMRQFFKDIREYSEEARVFSHNKKIVAIHIHGMKGHPGIDIGAGVKYHPRTEEFQTSSHPISATNSGNQTLSKNFLLTLCETLGKNFESENIPVTIGKYFPGWSKLSAIQYHHYKNPIDEAFHLEIEEGLRLYKEKRDILLTHLIHAVRHTFQ